MTAQLPELLVPPQLVDERRYWQPYPDAAPEGAQLHCRCCGQWRHCDPLTPVGGAAPVPGKPSRPHVSGSRDAPAPLRLDVLDLLAPVVREGGRPVDSLSVDTWAAKVPKLATGDTVELKVRQLRMQPIRDPDDNWIIGEQLVQEVHTVRVKPRQPVHDRRGRPEHTSNGDQVGHVPLAVVLDQEARAWLDAGAPGRFRPRPTVPELVQWLSRRLPWAWEHYEPIGEFRIMLSRLRGILLGVLGEVEPEPEPCRGVECERCDQRLLVRRGDGTGDVECQNPDCAAVFTAGQYRDWVRRLAGFERSRRSPQEVTALLRS